MVSISKLQFIGPNMISFLKKLFRKPAPKPNGVKITLVENVDINRALSFNIVLGFDVETAPDGSSTINLKVNRLTFISNNEKAKKYINMMDDGILKSTIAMLCQGASQHILTTAQGFSTNHEFDDIQPPSDKSQMN